MEITKQQVYDFYFPLIMNLLSQNPHGVLPECFEALEIAKRCVGDCIRYEDSFEDMTEEEFLCGKQSKKY